MVFLERKKRVPVLKRKILIHALGIPKEPPRGRGWLLSLGSSGQRLTREEQVLRPRGGRPAGSALAGPCGQTTHFRARLGLSGRIAVKSLQESDL